MEEIVTVDGRQFKLTIDRPLTASERQQVMADIRKQTGCGTCGQPRTLGFGGIQNLADSCTTATKASGQTVTLAAAPSGGVGPYSVRFWRKPTSAGAMAWEELGTTRSVNEGDSTSTNFTLYDLDISSALGDDPAGVLVTNTSGVLSEGVTAFTLAPSKIRVATTVYDSCPVTPQTCVTSCDVSLACVAPTCNFTVT